MPQRTAYDVQGMLGEEVAERAMSISVLFRPLDCGNDGPFRCSCPILTEARRGCPVGLVRHAVLLGEEDSSMRARRATGAWGLSIGVVLIVAAPAMGGCGDYDEDGLCRNRPG